MKPNFSTLAILSFIAACVTGLIGLLSKATDELQIALTCLAMTLIWTGWIFTCWDIWWDHQQRIKQRQKFKVGDCVYIKYSNKIKNNGVVISTGKTTATIKVKNDRSICWVFFNQLEKINDPLTKHNTLLKCAGNDIKPQLNHEL